VFLLLCFTASLLLWSPCFSSFSVFPVLLFFFAFLPCLLSSFFFRFLCFSPYLLAFFYSPFASFCFSVVIVTSLCLFTFFVFFLHLSDVFLGAFSFDFSAFSGFYAYAVSSLCWFAAFFLLWFPFFFCFCVFISCCFFSLLLCSHGSLAFAGFCCCVVSLQHLFVFLLLCFSVLSQLQLSYT